MEGSATCGSGNRSSLICGSEERQRLVIGRLLLSGLASADADRVEPPRGPQGGAPVETQRAERVRRRQPLDGKARDAGDGREPLDAGIAVAARGDEQRPISVSFRPWICRKPRRTACRLIAAVGSSVQSHALKLTSASRTSTPCLRASRTSWAG